MNFFFGETITRVCATRGNPNTGPIEHPSINHAGARRRLLEGRGHPMNTEIIGITLALAVTVTGGVLRLGAGPVAEGSKLQSPNNSDVSEMRMGRCPYYPPRWSAIMVDNVRTRRRPKSHRGGWRKPPSNEKAVPPPIGTSTKQAVERGDQRRSAQIFSSKTMLWGGPRDGC
jgi:hypothetical protein